MEFFSNQFKEAFRHGLIAGYCFTATFIIVFYMFYCLPTQLIKKRRKYKNDGRRKTEEMPKLPGQKFKQEKIKEVLHAQKLKKLRQKDRVFPTELLEKSIQVNKVGRLTYRMNFTKLCHATKYFSLDNVIGVGVIGIMYKAKLEWSKVIKIALGVARGLCCLHHSLHVVHLNINSDCILLGNNFEPKISNFGGAVFMNNDLNKNIGLEKKDVYDFGCLLFEMIKGKKFGQIHECFSNTIVPFATYTYPNHVNMLEDDPSGFCDAVDKYLNKIEFEDEEVSTLLRVAQECVHPLFEQRPTMLEVYNKICNIWERDRICEDDDHLSIDFITSTTSRHQYA